MEANALRVTTPSGTTELTGDRSAVIGRGRESEIIVTDTKVSRRHVLLEPGPDGWVARDLSSNGIWSDGARTQSVRVSGEVRLRLGGSSGPEVVLTAPRPAKPPQASTPSAPDLSEEETRLAAQGRGGPTAPPARVPAQVGAGSAPHQWAPGAAVPVGAAAAPAVGAGGPDSGRGPSAAAVWLRALPTLVWLAAVGFTLGALVALS